jgi:hypothetical protein
MEQMTAAEEAVNEANFQGEVTVQQSVITHCRQHLQIRFRKFVKTVTYFELELQLSGAKAQQSLFSN